MTNPHFPAQAQPITLYSAPLSGHAHRVQLFLSILDIPHEIIAVDMKSRAHKQPDYIAMHPFGQVPVLDDNGIILWDSNAVLTYLAKRYDPDGHWLPQDPIKAAQVQQWFSISASLLYNGPATARVITLLGVDLDYNLAQAVSKRLLRGMESELSQRAFLTGESANLADIAMYTYVYLAPDGGVDLSPYPHVNAWLERISTLDGFLPMKRAD